MNLSHPLRCAPTLAIVIPCYNERATIQQIVSRVQRVDLGVVRQARAHVDEAWVGGQIAPVERAIIQADLGLNPSNDGEIIRLPMPALTEERRREFVKIAKKYGGGGHASAAGFESVELVHRPVMREGSSS